MRSIVFAAILWSCGAHLLRKDGLGGDEIPYQYPIVDVHVPEPALSSTDRETADVAHAATQRELKQLQARIEEHHALVVSTMQKLTSKLQRIADAAGRATPKM